MQYEYEIYTIYKSQLIQIKDELNTRGANGWQVVAQWQSWSDAREPREPSNDPENAPFLNFLLSRPKPPKA